MPIIASTERQRNTVFSIVPLGIFRQTSFLSAKSKLDAAMKLRCYVCPKITCQTVMRKGTKKKSWFCNKEYIIYGFYSIYTTTNIDQNSTCVCTHIQNHAKVGRKNRCCSSHNNKNDEVDAVVGVATVQLGIESWFCISKRLMKREGGT